MSEKRQHLIDTAIALFSAHGFHATGIDRIADEANVSKKTMYHYFRSKEELILAALKHHDGVFRNEFMKAVLARSDDPQARLLAIFDVAHAWFADKKFYGCLFINAIGEYAAPDTGIRAVCQEYKRLMRGFLETLAQDAGVANPAALAASLALLLEGSIVTAQVTADPQAALTAAEAARVLLQTALASD